MRYIIYKHTIKQTSKSYIGFTTYTMEQRLKKHILNAKSGIKTKFYNAILKYGEDQIISEILAVTDTQNTAYDLEELHIEKYDTYKNGYNSTTRGGGGWIIGDLSDEAKAEYCKKRSLVTKGDKNPNYSGFTDDELVIAGAKFYNENGNIWSIRKWQVYSSKYGYPKTFSKCRFNGEGTTGFKKRISDYLGIEELNKYIKTDEHKRKLSERLKEKMWITNGIENKHINKVDICLYDDKWIKGKTNKNNN